MSGIKKIASLLPMSFIAVFFCSWSPVETISDRSVDDPYVSVNSNGEVFVVWTAEAYPNIVTQSAYYDGLYWNTNETISDSGFNVNPIIKIDSSGNATALWEALDIHTFFRDVVSASKPAGLPWESPSVVSDGMKNTFSTLAMNESGQSIAGWINEDNDTIEIITKASGGEWSLPQAISGSGGRKGTLQLAIDPAGNCLAVWEEFDNWTINSVITTSGFDSPWSTPLQISGIEYSTYPSLAVRENGDAIAAWIDGETYNILASIYNADTHTWEGSPTTLTSTYSYFPVCSAIDGAFLVTLQNLETGMNQLARFASGSWDVPANISNDYVSGIASTANDTTQAYTVWADLMSGSVVVSQCGATGSSTPPLEISAGNFNGEAWIDSSSDVSAVAWITYDNNGSYVQASVN